jgi:hypothetical protein
VPRKSHKRFAENFALVYRLLNPLGFVAFKMGGPARREEGAYLNRYVTDEQRSRRPIFNPTLGRGQLAVFPSGSCRTRPVSIQIWALRSRLEKQAN